jgi:eukaryotic-like serine/threonine-protein kinase
MLGVRYRIEEPPIGQGGMGIVYKAYDDVKKCFVAIKTFRGEMEPRSVELFHKEWRLLSQLSHPNIVDVLDVGEFSDNGQSRPYFVMPLLPGRTLDKLIKTSGPRLTPERIVEIMCQTCRGLQAAHDNGLVHRDLKPSNLFVMNDDTVKIIDFGIVHLVDAQTKTGLKGTLQYMAPEQLDMKPANARSDIFSLAVVCYEALTGRKPFDRSSPEEVVDAIRSHMPPPASELNPATNDQISRTVQKAMAKQAYHRFSTAREFSEILQRSMRNEHIELFDRNKIQPRINRIKKALHEADYQLAIDMLDELESEGNVDAEMSLLRVKTEQAARARTIYQFIESARTRMEEQEYPLAMQNVQRVLDLDPGNIDALAMKAEVDRRRSFNQVEKWLQIAQQHFDNKLFAKARQAIEEIKKVDPSNKPAADMLAAINRGEGETNKLRQEKQQLYDAALKGYRAGEISSALSKLERVLDLGKRVPGHAATDAQYLALYDEIRSERDELQNSYAEGKRALESRDFSRATEICQEVLRRRPGEALFMALKIEVEDRRRQEDSATIARLHVEIEGEPDLERKFAIVSDAVRRFPDEQMFSHSLKLIKERRDLVNSIVARARHYESQRLFVEASNQWDVVRKVYSQYPGLDYELQRLSRKQEEYGKEEAKAGWVSQIDRALFTGDYSRAEDLLGSALIEAPHDGELLRLKEQVEESTRKSIKARALLEEGQRFVVAGDRLGAIQKFRLARELDGGNAPVREALRAECVEHARALAERDWRAALPFLEEALEIDRADPGAASVSRLVDDIRQREQIERCIVEARGLQTQRRVKEALAKVDQALREYPNEVRLSQLRNTLLDSEGASSSQSSGRYVAARDESPAEQRAAQPENTPETNYSAVTNFFSSPLDRTLETQVHAAPDEIAILPVAPRQRATTRRLEEGPAGIAPGVKFAAAAAAVLMALGGGFFFISERNVPPAKTIDPASRTHPSTPSVDPPPPQPRGPGPAEPPPVAPPKPAPAKSSFPFRFVTSVPAMVTMADNHDLNCITPCELTLSRGEHTVQLSAPGYDAVNRPIQVPQENNLFQELTEELKTVRIASDPSDADVTVDNESKGRTPITLRLSVGEHTIKVSQGGKMVEKTINVPEYDLFLNILLNGDAHTEPLTPRK